MIVAEGDGRAFTSGLKSLILLSESILGNCHLGPQSLGAVWAILGDLRSPVSDVCCWVKMLLQQPGSATSNGTKRRQSEKKLVGGGLAGGGG